MALDIGLASLKSELNNKKEEVVRLHDYSQVLIKWGVTDYGQILNEGSHLISDHNLWPHL